MNNSKLKSLLLLHILLMTYSLSGILSKNAANESFLSFKWCLLYSGMIFLLGIYAIGWQQIIKRLPLTDAYANKAVVVIWGIIWGYLFFKESITVYKVLGAVLIIAGVVIFAFDSNTNDDSLEGGSK